jgi:hypothetical protein
VKSSLAAKPAMAASVKPLLTLLIMFAWFELLLWLSIAVGASVIIALKKEDKTVSYLFQNYFNI